MSQQRQKKSANLIIFGVTLLIGLLLAVWLRTYLAHRRFDRRVEQLRAEGRPTSIPELKPEAVAPESNAATVLETTWSDAEVAMKTLAPLYNAKNDWHRNPTEGQLQVLRTAVETHAEMFDLFDRAASADHYASCRDFTVKFDQFLQNSMQGDRIRNVARLLRAKATKLRSEGKHDEAFRCGIQILRLGRLGDNEPGSHSYLIALAVRSNAVQSIETTLLSGDLADDVRVELDAELAKHDSMAGFISMHESERALVLHRISEGGPLGRMLRNEGDEFLDWMEQELEWGSRSWYEVPAAADAYADTPGRPFHLKQLLPSFQASREAMNRTRAYLRTLRVLNAIQHTRLTEATTVDLDQLGLPHEATIDPYTGKQMILKRRPAGWSVYAVGSDGTDDGGRFQKLADVGVGARPDADE